MPPRNQSTDTPEKDGELRLPRVAIDMKLPLPVVAAAAITLAWGAISMYYQLHAVVEAMADVRAGIKESRDSTANVIGELTTLKGRQGLLEYRIEKLEAQKEGRK